MPGEQSGPLIGNSASGQLLSDADLFSTLHRLSPKAGLAVFLPVGFFLFLLSRFARLLILPLIQLSGYTCMAKRYSWL